MKSTILIFIFTIGFLKSFSQASLSQGVIEVTLSKLSYLKTIPIFNENGAVIFSILRDSSDGEYKIVSNKNAITKKLKIRYYYPDYGILVFDCIKAGKNHYEILINDSVYTVYYEDNKKYLTYYKWEDFLKTIILNLNNNSCLLVDTTSKQIVPNFQKYAYKVKKVIGDWCYVECFKECDEGCPLQPLHGWVRWKKHNRLIVDIRFEC